MAEESEQSLQKQLNELEVSFAQEELVRILGEHRCARNPLRLSNAMAGLPYLTARVSYDRCSKIECTVWPKFDFQVFRKIEAIWNSRERYRDLLIGGVVSARDQETSKDCSTKQIRKLFTKAPGRKFWMSEVGN